MNIRQKNNTVTCTGHYLQSVLAWCANCQGRRHLGKHWELGEKTGRSEFEHNSWNEFFPTAYVSGDIIFTGNSAGAQRSAMQCLYKAKTWGKSQEAILNTFRQGRVLFHLQSKISAVVHKRKFCRVLLLLRGGWHSLCVSLALRADRITPPLLRAPQVLLVFWCRVSVCVPEWYHAQSSGVSTPNNAVGSALFVWTCTDCNQGCYG